ncbi:DUF2442 domain-containing protein [Pseudomonas reactans]|jgi:hypothetical protein|uniref:DUF2442 domain-containing protein n=2 Tax=Pseudomonas TaxID=286 RepID=A0A7Y8KF36_9PSED|nr:MULTISPECIES: DUF2442 domain-containing protein [Pseudomonas]ETK23596.1 hypothetical protein H096_09672 [Pseudomonas sp. FH1]KGE66642.1 hypothetical protein K814_0117810 [Pseudomonas fluorescens LMG 5329]NWC76954.1 DUF2442 domain-containing protein [Pseudomonas sp. P7759]NWD79877.1 DUF2442 domain-containing protein [Pseudomonas reactans]NWD99947.1 DUF2442 domain-containing protein [Pseudomonas sp. IPO3749]
MKQIVKAKAVPYKPLTEADVEKAIARGRKTRHLYARASSVRYEDNCISIGFSDGSRVVLPVAGLPEFEGFSLEDFAQLEVGFGGKALCCEAQDLDVSVTGLIATSKPLMDLATSLVASRNGRKSSAAKAAAARANGKKGGRPRKKEPEDVELPPGQ